MKQFILSILFFVSMCGLDFYSQTTDIYREGKIRFALMFGSVLLFLKLKNRIGYGASLFICYSSLVIIFKNYPLFGFFSSILLIAVPLIAISIADTLNIDRIEKILIGCGVFQAVLGIMQFFFGFHLIAPFYDSCLIAQCDLYEVVGTLGQHTVMGSFLMLILPIALWRSNWICASIIGFCIALTCSSMSIGASIVVLGLFAIHKFGWKHCLYFWSIIAVIGFCVWLKNPDLYIGETRHSLFKFMGRDKIWPIAWDLFKVGPISGQGIGYWAMWSSLEIGTTFQTVWDKVHCDPLQMLIEQGIPGLLACLYACYEFIKSFKLGWPQCVVIGMIVNSLANFPFHLITHALIFCLAWIFCMKKEELSYA